MHLVIPRPLSWPLMHFQRHTCDANCVIEFTVVFRWIFVVLAHREGVVSSAALTLDDRLRGLPVSLWVATKHFTFNFNDVDL